MINQEKINTILAEERTLLVNNCTFSAGLEIALTAMAGGLAILRLISFKTEFHKIIAHIIGRNTDFMGTYVIVF